MKRDNGQSERLYGLVYFTTLALFGLLLGVAFLEIGGLGLKLALAFAIAALIALYFMGLRTASNLVRLFAGGGLLWIVFMFVLTFSDYMMR